MSAAAKFEKMRDRLPRLGRDPKHKFVGSILPPQPNATAICLFAYHTAERAGRSNAAMELSAQCYEKDNINECWLFGFDVDEGNRLDRTGSTLRKRRDLQETQVEPEAPGARGDAGDMASGKHSS